MSNDQISIEEKKYNKWIIILSVVIPVVVATLFGIKIDAELPIFLPPIYATINAINSISIDNCSLGYKK